jgi:hypothetical protein
MLIIIFDLLEEVNETIKGIKLLGSIGIMEAAKLANLS